VSGEQVFISYRRADSGGWARSLHDQLDTRLGPGLAFRDVAMQDGVDFHEHVESLLDRCDVVLAVIGRRWTTIADAEGHRRLDDPNDLVRSEIARALQRPDVHVIPVLVDGAPMPAEEELPRDLAPLSRRQARELSDSRWDYDVETLAGRLRELLGEKPPRRPWRSTAVRIGLATAAVLAVGLLLWFVLQLRGGEAPSTRQASLAHPTLEHLDFAQYLDRKAIDRDSYQPAVLRRPGAFVTFDFRIEGYKGKRLPLRWQLIDARNGNQIKQSRAVSITPDANTDSGSWDVWTPVPTGADRRFFVQVQLYNDRGVVPIARLRTETFAPAR
jgi:TIR domain-containing protein